MAKTKRKFFTRITDWFRGMKSELKKVVWPTPKQVLNNSLIVLGVMFACSIIVWGFDSVASALVELLVNIFS